MTDTGYRKTTLDNGLRVITERMPSVRSASLGIWVGVGSAHEDARVRGISHCIEHMLFKGTPTRTARQIAEAMDAIGGNMNAFTEKEATCYHARVVDAHVPLALGLLADMFLHSNFDPAELRKEQQVIVEEIRMYDDAPDEVAQDLFVRSVWPSSPLGEPVIGYQDTVMAVTRDDIMAFMQRAYTPDAVLVTVAGNVDHDEVVHHVSKLMGGMRGASRNGDPVTPAFVAEQVVKPKECEQVVVLFGREGSSARDDRRYIISIVDAVLGGGMASRLFQEIREQRGLAYSVYTTHSTYRNGGLFTAGAQTGPKTAAEVVALMRAEMQRMGREGMTADEIDRAKEHLKGSLLLSMESTSNRMFRLGRSEMTLGRHVPAAEIAQRIDAVTESQANEMARTLFDTDAYALTVLGPIAEDFLDSAEPLAASA